jgi:dGTPase
MDWADDVAYSVHDVEDGVHAGLIRLGSVDDSARGELCALAADHYTATPAAELAPVLDRLLELPSVRDLAGYDGSLRAQALAKRATSELTGRFAGAAVAATRERFGPAPLGRYDGTLEVPPQTASECALLKAVALRFVMRRPGAADRQARQRRLLTELVSAVLDGAPDTLDAGMAGAWQQAEDDAARLRVVTDQVAQLTDTSAVAWHWRLVRPVS